MAVTDGKRDESKRWNLEGGVGQVETNKRARSFRRSKAKVAQVETVGGVLFQRA